MEGNLKSKELHKLLLLTIKYIPMVIAACYVLNTVLCVAHIDVPILSNIAGMSILTWIFLYLSAVVFRFCNYHKMFLWYILVSDIINIFDYYFYLPINDSGMYLINFSVIGVFLYIILYLYVKSNKKSTTKDSR